MVRSSSSFACACGRACLSFPAHAHRGHEESNSKPCGHTHLLALPIRRYSRRQINNVLLVTGDEQFRSIILMLKMLESNTHNNFKQLTTSLAGNAGILLSQLTGVTKLDRETLKFCMKFCICDRRLKPA